MFFSIPWWLLYFLMKWFRTTFFSSGGRQETNITWYSEIEEPIKLREKYYCLVLYMTKSDNSTELTAERLCFCWFQLKRGATRAGARQCAPTKWANIAPRSAAALRIAEDKKSTKHTSGGVTRSARKGRNAVVWGRSPPAEVCRSLRSRPVYH